MAYTDMGPGEANQAKSTGVVVPMTDGRGNPYPEFLRTQQVGLGVVRAVVERIDAALQGGAIKLATVHLGDSGKAMFKAYLLSQLLPELWGDPIPPRVKAVKKIVSPKAVGLIDRRLSRAFDPPGGVLRLPGVTLTSKDLFDLLQLVNEELLADDEFDAGDSPQPAERAVAVVPAGPVAAVTSDMGLDLAAWD